jgi:hypothetical protein
MPATLPFFIKLALKFGPRMPIVLSNNHQGI